ncbi:MAG: class I SAM-dependent methyltransferase [Nitrospinae bacterium]|nr:class I SAM-dependent methyltransferase [Nitrospinota bacterium]MBL7020282.1 class I SAM-dependent methyltransferase [Nitrospinaceae bacterium]
MTCPLCSFSAHYLTSGENREYWLCSRCRAISVPASFHISPDEEVKRYLEHENSLESEGYVRMFQEKIDILQAYDIKSALDYGCGYEPVLKTLLERQGIKADGYDPNFFPDTCREKLYDLVISTETFEHFRTPAEEISRIADRVVPGGILAIMTRFYPTADKDFADWYYKRDPTHIIFYCSQTFQWIAENTGFKLIFNNEHDFVVLKKPGPRPGGIEQ